MLTISLFNIVYGEIEGARQGGGSLDDVSLYSANAKAYIGPTHRTPRPLRRNRRRRLPRVAARAQRSGHDRPRLRGREAEVPLRPRAARRVPVGQHARRRAGAARPPLFLRGRAVLLVPPVPAARQGRGATLPPRHGVPQLHRHADDGQDRLLRPGSVREDHQSAVDPRQDRPALARRDGEPRDRGRPHAVLRPAAARRRRDRRDAGAGSSSTPCRARSSTTRRAAWC